MPSVPNVKLNNGKQVCPPQKLMKITITWFMKY